MLRALAIALLLSAGSAAAADDATRVWLNPGVYSHHFKRDQDYREDNYGVGAEVAFAPRHAVLAGSFINSNRERSRYAGYYWRPWHWRPAGVRVSAGVVLAMIDGYSNQNGGGWFPAAVPSLSAEYGLYGANLTFIPNSKNGSALALQLKMLVW
jgi:hypothetical protein